MTQVSLLSVFDEPVSSEAMEDQITAEEAQMVSSLLALITAQNP